MRLEKLTKMMAVVACIMTASISFAQSNEHPIQVSVEARSFAHGENPQPIILVKIKNISKESINILVWGDIPWGITFDIKNDARASLREDSFTPSIRQHPVTLKPGENHVIEVNLRRFFRFKEPGEFSVDYSVQIEYYLEKHGLQAEFLKKAESRGSIKLRESRKSDDKSKGSTPDK
jgi:hypothetical protein